MAKQPGNHGKKSEPKDGAKPGLTRPLVRYAPQPPPTVEVLPPSSAPAPVDPEIRSLPIAIDPAHLQQSIKDLASEVGHLLKKGRYTKVRIKLRNTPLLPDIPVGVALAAGGMGAALLGPLQAVLGTMVGKTVLDVELISDAAHHVSRGRELILAGELEAALAQFRTAVAIDRDHAPAYLNIGVALKLQGDRGGARIAFERASALDPKGPAGLEAEKLLATLR